jgi:tetratricopeptide (TPR) repeat protein
MPANAEPLAAVEPLPECGRLDPFKHADGNDVWPRGCRPSGIRTYKRQYSGLGYQILDSESEACFVPDEAYAALDQILNDAKALILSDPATKGELGKTQALAISADIGQVLLDHGFGIYIPTDHFADAMILRNNPTERERHVVDCDTSSFIYLTVAENLKLPLSLVEVKLSAHSTHNYVRWELGESTIDWDTNGSGPCKAPTNLLPFQGKAMTRTQTLGYARRLRASLWESRRAWDFALADYRFAAANYPDSSESWNDLAWLVATRNISRRAPTANEALVAAQRAVSISRTPDTLDTLACVYALQQRFREALIYEAEALNLDPDSAEFTARLIKFTQHSDCTIANPP